jgi:hypothetical protein
MEKSAPTTLMRILRALEHCLPWVVLVWINQAAADACAPFIEERPAWASASFRPHNSAFEACSIDEELYRQVIADWLQQQPATRPDITSLSLGRAADFPWISRFIADAALLTPNGAVTAAQSRISERDHLARSSLHDPALLQRLAAPFADSRYTVIGLSYEKVLFGPADKHASPPVLQASSTRGGAALEVPYDAQLWLRLAPRNTLPPTMDQPGT